MAQQSGVKINLNHIHIILVKPQMGENIGAVARVMMNFGFTNLKIVSPRDGWPNEKAKIMSVGASAIIDNALIYNDFSEAIADCNLLYAATARPRYINKPVLSAEEGAKDIAKNCKLQIGIVIGPENFGLNNEEIAITNKIITIPVNPEFSSINIAQATGIICYELSKQEFMNINQPDFGQIASNEEINGLFNHLEAELDDRNFYRALDKREGMINNLRSMFKRIENFTSQDVRTLRGVIRCLAEYRKERVE